MDGAIAATAAAINATTYRFLVLIREFDERAGYLRWSLSNSVEWLHWRCDLSPQAARDRLRVAHALKDLPEISQAFEQGRLSYSKVRALTRIATRHTEAALLAFALGTTAARVEERVRQLRNGEPTVSSEDVAALYASRHLNVVRDASRGTVRLVGEIPLEQGELILQALEKAINAGLEDGNGAEFARESFAAQQADALVALASAYLRAGREEATDQPGASPACATAENYQVLIHVDASALAGEGGRSDVPVETARRLCCDGSVVRLEVDGQGEPLSIGRKQRSVPPAIRRALHARDRQCAFPGCHHTRYLDAHHIRHWSEGGETSLENLVLLCSRHHRLVHEGGYTMRRDHRGEWYFRRADGRAVPAVGYRVEDVTDDDEEAEAACAEGGIRHSLQNADVGSTAGPPSPTQVRSASAEAEGAGGARTGNPRDSAEAPAAAAERAAYRPGLEETDSAVEEEGVSYIARPQGTSKRSMSPTVHERLRM